MAGGGEGEAIMKAGLEKPRPGPYRRKMIRLLIKDRQTEKLSRELAQQMDLPVEKAIDIAVGERLARVELAMRRRVEWSRGRRPTKPIPVR
jgi:hypothetical protein